MHDTLPAGARVVLIDSSAILKSCFEGYREARTSAYKGRALDVAGLFGYLYRIQKIYEEFEFETLVHVLDPPGGSFYRYHLYPAYKGNRKDDDPVLAGQKALLPAALAAFGERCIRMRGVESDDILATLAQQCVDAGHQVMIISPDKDLLQLVSEGEISVARYVDNPTGFGKTYEIYENEAEVVRKLGVRPDQVADFLALVGDSADNIPGVHKVGPKTAQGWMAEYGDLATLLTHIDQIKGKTGENLRDAAGLLPLYQKLTSVLRDVPNVGIPVAPEVDEAEHAAFRELLLLKDTFPARFRVGGGFAPPVARPTPAPAPRPAPAPALTAPAHDALADPVPASTGDVLGSLFGNDPPDAGGRDDGFGGLDDAPAPPPPSPGGRPMRMR